MRLVQVSRRQQEEENDLRCSRNGNLASHDEPCIRRTLETQGTCASKTADQANLLGRVRSNALRMIGLNNDLDHVLVHSRAQLD
jgi:hypothetical protein